MKDKIKLSTIKLNPNNPRLVKDDKFDKLCKSIQSFGDKMLPLRPLVIDESNTILGGNMRYNALKHLGFQEIPKNWVKIAENLTDKQKEEFIIKDNIGYGDWDWEELKDDWDLEELDDWGLDIPEFDDFNVEDAMEDDYTPPEKMKVDVIEGDLIQIGEHRLLCGDSTNSDDVERLMNGEKADLAHNDPPYGMKKEKDGVKNDNLNQDELLTFNKDWINLQFTFLKENASWYCWGIDEPLMDIYSFILKPLIKTQKATFRNLITWNKGDGNGINTEEGRKYAEVTEKCLFVMCGVQGFNNNADNYFEGFEPIRSYLVKEKAKSGLKTSKIIELTSSSQKHYWGRSQWFFIKKEDYNTIKKASNGKAFNKEYDELKREYDKIKSKYYGTRAYFNNTHENMTNVWNFSRTNYTERKQTGGHATPKPIEICERVIKSSSIKNALVIDFFCGSGSTMVASHQLNRKCYAMELQPKYCQVIIDRMSKLDPSLEIKINGKKYKQKEVIF